MAAISWGNVTAVFGTTVLGGVDAGHQTDILALVNDEMPNSAEFGGDDSTKYRLARIYLAGHLGLSTSSSAARSGAVRSKTIAKESLTVSYGELLSVDSLKATEPGRLYLGLLRTSPARCGYVAGIESL